MLIGYARISTDDQKLNLQFDALKKAGCEKIYQDIMSGSAISRPGLDKLLDNVREGDTVIIWRLDILSRSLKELIDTVNLFQKKNIQLKSLQENIDTNSSAGKLIFHVFGAMAEFERNIIRDRTNAGLAAARARGRVGGRPTKLSAEKIKLVLKLYHEQQHSTAEICKMMDISGPTLYQYIKKYSK